MLFNSIEYLLFLPLVFTIYWLLNKHIKAQNLFLLSSSYFFYGLWDYRFLSLILISSFCDFYIAKELVKENRISRRKLLLGLSIFINLGFLFYFKYCNFFIESFQGLSKLLGFNANLTSLNIILPVGISFYTFQTLSYTIDIYRKKVKPAEHWLTFFTFVAYFPQLVAGPIERATNLLPQIENRRKFNYKFATDGMRQILWGLFKKVAIADNCALLVDLIFEDPGSLNSGTLCLGVVLFSIQIYCDFSGYSDIAIGTSKLLGIKLMQNFATPYFARDIAEFWRRWHISLSTWFRDYLYIPLGGSRVGLPKKIRNVFAIFLVSGFWHGANWTFIVWGLIHAVCFVPQIVLNTNRNYLSVVAEERVFPTLKEIISILKTWIIVGIAWIFFRANSVTEAFEYTQFMSYKNFSVSSFSNDLLDLEIKHSLLFELLLFITLLMFVEWFNRREEHGLGKLTEKTTLRYLLYLMLSLISLQYLYGESTFIYFQF